MTAAAPASCAPVLPLFVGSNPVPWGWDAPGPPWYRGAVDGDRSAVAGAVRLVAAITLLTVVVFYPVHAHYTDVGAASLRPVYALHVVVAGLVLAATFTGLAQWAGALSVVFVLGLTANVLLYVYLVPYGIPT